MLAQKRVDRFRRVLLLAVGWFLAGHPPVVSAAPLTRFEQFLAGGPAHWSTTHLMTIPQDVKLTHADGTLRDNLAVQYVMWERDRNPIYFDHRHPVLGPLLANMEQLHGSQFLSMTHAHGHSAQAQAIHAESTTQTQTQAQTQSTGSGTPEAQVLTAASLTPSVSDLPSPGGFYPPIAEEISSSSVVTTNVGAFSESEIGNPAPVPEPSTLAMALLLFATALGWKRWLPARG